MTGNDIAVLGALLAIFAVVPPLVLLRGESRRRYLAVDAAFTLGGVALLAIVSSTQREVTFGLILATTLLLKVTLFVVCARLAAGQEELLFTAPRAALLAVCVYLVLVPWTLRVPIDGDEPYYLLQSESLLQDFDLDLSNQYARLGASATGRVDLRPQQGDPVGEHGEQYSRHEPLLALLLVPGLFLGGKAGAVATIAIFAALLVWSLTRLLEEEGLSQATIVTTIAAIAFGPPLLFYAVRMWPEVPAALAVSEALRAARQRRPAREAGALVLLSLLKLRFVLIAVPLFLLTVFRKGLSRRALLVVLLLLLPLGVLWMSTGSATSVHELSEFRLHPLTAYLRGVSGLLIDGQGGFLFAAPMLLMAIVLWPQRWLSPEVRAGLLAAVPYMLLLLPRAEWHGGWSPPLRYVVVFTPLLAALLGHAIERLARVQLLVLTASATALVVVHGVAYPSRLFHIANGESWIGEWLSVRHQADFSRVVPSLIRFNSAAVVFAVALLVVAGLVAWRGRDPLRRFGAAAPLVASLAIAVAAVIGAAPGRIVHFEDAHVRRAGGELEPHRWTVARFAYTGGWKLRHGDSLSFRHRGGHAVLYYKTGMEALLQIDGRAIRLEPALRFAAVPVRLSGAEEHQIVCVGGEIILDRVESR